MISFLAYFNATGATYLSNAAFGEGLGPIQLNSLNCRGTEGRLVNCTESARPARCTHAEDVGVVCQGEGEKGLWIE